MARLMGIRLAPDIYAGQEGYQGDNIFFHNSMNLIIILIVCFVDVS